MTTYTIQEIEAIRVIRKSMLTKPEIINRIMQDGSREMAVRVLVQAKDELAQLLEVNRAFIAASSALVKMEKNDGA
jgi:ribosomal protein S7